MQFILGIVLIVLAAFISSIAAYFCVFPRLPGIKFNERAWLAGIIFAVIQTLVAVSCFAVAASVSTVTSVFAALGGGAKGVPMIFGVVLTATACFVFIVTTALIAATQIMGAVRLEKATSPFIAALVLMCIQIPVGALATVGALAMFGPSFQSGYIDKTGKFVIEPRYRTADKFKNGIARVVRSDDSDESHYTFIDREGKPTDPPKNLSEYLPKAPADKLDDDPASYEDNGSFSAGRYSIASHGLKMLPFSEGLALAQHDADAGWGFVDESFKFVIPANSFDDARHFKEGLAPATRFFDTEGHQLAIGAGPGGPEIKKWGYIDASGKWVIKPAYDSAECFSDGLARVTVRSAKEPNVERYGFIDKTGKFVIEPKFSYADSFSEGLAAAQK